MNPTYYDLENTENENVNVFLSNLVENAINELEESYCVDVMEVYRISSIKRRGAY